eukprot:tig00020675_g12596.t1
MNLPSYDPHIVEHLKKLAREHLEDISIRLTLENIPHSKAVLSGDARHELPNLAQEVDADAIIVGTRGLGLASRAFLGSVSSDLVHNSPVSVLVVPMRPGAEDSSQIPVINVE